MNMKLDTNGFYKSTFKCIKRNFVLCNLQVF